MKPAPTRACPSELELSRAFSEGAGAQLSAHLSGCEACRHEWEVMQQLADAARLHAPTPSAPQSAEMRAGLMRAAAGLGDPRSAEGRSWRVAALAMAAAAAVVVGGVALWSETADEEATELASPSPEPSAAPEPSRSPAPSLSPEPRPSALPKRATVVAHGDATFLHVVEPLEEVVRLIEGTVTVSVEHLRPGERFRVVAGDGEVEVKGTVFDVVVEGDALRAVRVVTGRVEVRREGAPLSLLDPGDRWTPEEPEQVSEVEVATPRPGAARAPQKRAPRAPARDTRFSEAWQAYRDGRLQEAERGFSAIADGPLAQDAAFWRAAALKRLGRSSEATAALRAFLKRWGAAARAGEARVMLGWLRLEAGALGEARTLFEAGVSDRSAKVRASAQKGLDRTSEQ